MRDRQLDLLRGFSVLGMFFFSLILFFCDHLPLILIHNSPGHMLPGDFVLTTFLFVSGVSISILRSRYSSPWSPALWKKVGARLCVMVAVSCVVTPFSVGSFLGMDEIMLNAVLTPPTVIIAGASPTILYGIILAVGIWYSCATFLGAPFISPEQYLGGYRAALLFLPIMIGGILIQKRAAGSLRGDFILWSAITAVSLVVWGLPDKMGVNPTFMAFSCVVSIGILAILRAGRITHDWIEYCGQHSLRMWFLMFVLLGPLRLFAEMKTKRWQLSLEWYQAVALAIGWMIVCYWISRLIDLLPTKKSAKSQDQRV